MERRGAGRWNPGGRTVGRQTGASALWAKPAGEVGDRWSRTEPTVWTDRMLTALQAGVKGGLGPPLGVRGGCALPPASDASVSPVYGSTTDRRAVCGRSACTVRREGRPGEPGAPTPMKVRAFGCTCFRGVPLQSHAGSAGRCASGPAPRKRPWSAVRQRRLRERQTTTRTTTDTASGRPRSSSQSLSQSSSGCSGSRPPERPTRITARIRTTRGGREAGC